MSQNFGTLMPACYYCHLLLICMPSKHVKKADVPVRLYCRGSMGTVETVWVLRGSMGTARQYGYCQTVWVLSRQYGYCEAVWVLLARQYGYCKQYSAVSRFPDRPHYSSRAPVITHTLLWVTAQEVVRDTPIHLLSCQHKFIMT